LSRTYIDNWNSITGARTLAAGSNYKLGSLSKVKKYLETQRWEILQPLFALNSINYKPTSQIIVGINNYVIVELPLEGGHKIFCIPSHFFSLGSNK
jgi:hypothetical protein